jgi:GMP synthase-like glutamine amidotransferase
MRIGLLKADYVNDAQKILHGDLGDMFYRFLSVVMTVDLTVYEVRHGQYPTCLEAQDAYIISGSRFSVNDSDPWVDKLMDFIRTARNRVPVIGFCFGHQAIAKALGGHIGSRLVPNIGARKIKMLSYPAWAASESDVPQALFNHSEQVLKVPLGATIIAGDAICPTQIIQFTPRLLGIQAHPEYCPAYQDALMELNSRVTPEALANARNRTQKAQLTEHLFGRWVRNFLIGNIPAREIL